MILPLVEYFVSTHIFNIIFKSFAFLINDGIFISKNPNGFLLAFNKISLLYLYV